MFGFVSRPVGFHQPVGSAPLSGSFRSHFPRRRRTGACPRSSSSLFYPRTDRSIYVSRVGFPGFYLYFSSSERFSFTRFPQRRRRRCTAPICAPAITTITPVWVFPCFPFIVSYRISRPAVSALPSRLFVSRVFRLTDPYSGNS